MSTQDIPLATASIFSILTFAWVTPMMVGPHYSMYSTLPYRSWSLQTLGYQRTLQATDLWKLDKARSSETLSKRFDESWTRRKHEADTWNYNLEKGIVGPGRVRRYFWATRSIFAGSNYSNKFNDMEKQWRQVDGKKNASIALALNDTVGFFFWTGGIFKVRYGAPPYFHFFHTSPEQVFGDTSQLMGPLLIKAHIEVICYGDSKINH